MALTVVNLRMLFDCRIILGGYVGAWMEDYMEELKKLVRGRCSIEKEEDYLIPFESISKIGSDIILIENKGDYRRGKRPKRGLI